MAIGTLTVDVIGNIATLVSDLGKAQRESAKAARNIQSMWEKAGRGITEALSFVGISASIEGLREMVTAAAEAAAKADDMARSIGASVKTIQTIGYAAKVAGGSVEGLQAGFVKLEKSAIDAANGNSQAAAAFQAIGLSAAQVSKLLKNPDELIRVTTQRLASFQDGAGKTAVALQLMGKGAAENIPVLDDLGSNLGKLSDEAKKSGAALSDDQKKGLSDARKAGLELSASIDGLVNLFAADLAPVIAETARSMRDFAQSESVKTFIKRLADEIKNLNDQANELSKVPSEVEEIGKIFEDWYSGANNAVTAIDRLDIAFANLFKTLNGGTEIKIPQWMQWLLAPLPKAFGALGRLAADAFSSGPNFGNVIGGSSKVDFSNVTGGAQTSKKPVDLKPVLDDNAEAARAAAKALTDLQQIIDSIAGNTSSYDKKWQEYNATLDKIQANVEAVAKAHGDVAKAQELAKQATAALNEQMRATGDATRILSIALSDAQNTLAEHVRLSGLSDEEQRAEAYSAQLLAKAREQLKDVTGPLTEEQQRLLDSTKAIGYQMAAFDEQMRQQKETMQEWSSIFSNAASNIADAFAAALVRGGSLLKSLADIAKNVVQQIIAYFARLAVINPILNSIFGAVGGSLLPTLAGAGGLFGGVAGGAASTAAGASSFNIMQPATWLAAGKSLWGGFSGAMQSFWSGSQYNPASVNFVGPPVAGQTFGPQFGGYSSGFGQALGIAGGVYSGVNEYNRAGGGLAGIAGGAAYGAGTYVLGAGLSSAAAGTGFAAGLGALGPIGWVALGAMLVDKFSGGKLFGTEGKVIGGGSTFDVTSSGVDLSQHYTTKGQKPLFGGATFDEHAMAPSQEAIDAADQFFESLKTGTANFAKQFGVTMGDIVGGSFAQTFDAKGNVTGSTTTIAGHTYSGESQDQFTERLQSENMLAVLGQFDAGLNAAVDQFRANADQLMAVTGALANAESMMQAGTKFLALGSDQSLTSLLNLAEGAQQFGESIDQTLQRIEQAQQAYDQFVAQFKPAGTYVDDFEGAMAQLRNQFQANIDQANALAKAAGAAGASTEDLANITQAAAVAQAALISQLKASAQDLAFSLGLTTTGSLDAVNQEIQRLQAEAGGGANAVRGFGNAMQSTAQAATDAMNLLLGTLSPLNDQQKLQQALSGLRAGTVSQDQVLEIGRRLYASSQAYTDLFNQVQHMGQSASAAIGANGGAPSGLSGPDAARLQELLKEQSTLQAAQTQAQYQTLAQQIAEIASSTGEDWQKVIADMGINAADLEKGLGLANDDALTDYLAAIQTQTDSNGENTTSIIDAIHDIGDQITAAITAAPPLPDESGGVKQTNDLLNSINENLGRIAIVTADGNEDAVDALTALGRTLQNIDRNTGSQGGARNARV